MIRRGIVVTHGVGQQRRADQLSTIVEPLVAFLGRSLGHGNVHLTARTGPDEDGVATAWIFLRKPGCDLPVEEWVVREAWWAESFRPSTSGTIIIWALRAFWHHIQATYEKVFLRNIRRVLPWMDKPSPQGTGVWASDTPGPVRAVLDAAVWAFIMVGYLILYAVALGIIIPLYVLLVFPFNRILPAKVRSAQLALINLLTSGIGDQQAMTNRRVAVAGAANTVARGLWYFLAPNRPDDPHTQQPAHYDTVTVVAHSGGGVVSYEALVRGDIRGWMREDPPVQRVTWVTVGSGLNLAWRMRARRKAREQAFWNRSLREYVNWIDIYARYDPVPQGEPPHEMVRGLIGEQPAPYRTLRVANTDWPFTDHSAYWGNREEVMSRIVHAVTDSRLARQPLNELSDGSYGTHDLSSSVKRAVEATSNHRSLVTRNRVLTLLALCAGGMLLLAFGSQVGEWGTGQRNELLGLAWPDLSFRRRLGRLTPEWANWFVGALSLVLLAVIALTLLKALSSFLSWSRLEVDDPPPPSWGRVIGSARSRRTAREG